MRVRESEPTWKTLVIRQSLDVTETEEASIGGNEGQVKDQCSRGQKAVRRIQVVSKLSASESDLMRKWSQFGGGDRVRYPLSDIAIQFDSSLLMQGQYFPRAYWR